MTELDTTRLPLTGAVLELGDHHDGRTRVTFRNLAAIYFLDDNCAVKDQMLSALKHSHATGEELQLTYDLNGKRLTGFQVTR